MSTTPDSNAESQRLEMIVSYLDGELTAEESARVERKLAKDEHFRKELQGLDMAWSALDRLPAVTVDDKFSKTTMELVVKDATHEVQQRTMALPVQRRKRVFTTALALATSAILGALVYRIVSDNPNDQLLADLPIVHHIDLYSNVDDVAFISALEKEVPDALWIPEPKAQDLEQQMSAFQQVRFASEREDYLNQLSSEEKASLRVKFNRFQVLSLAEQEDLRDLHQGIVDLGKSHLPTLFKYHQWLKTMPTAEQYEIRKISDPQERAQLVASMLESQRRDEAMKLSDDELNLLVQTAVKLVTKVFQENKDTLSTQQKQAFKKADEHEKIFYLFSSMNRTQAQTMRSFFQELTQVLPEDARKLVEEAPIQDRNRIVMNFLRQARARLGPNGKRGRVTEEQLESFFVEELSLSEQEKLLALPRDQMLTRLKQMYRGNSVQESQSERDRGFNGPSLGDDWRGGPGPGFGGPRRPGDGPPGRRGPRPGEGFGRFRNDQDQQSKSPFNQPPPPREF